VNCTDDQKDGNLIQAELLIRDDGVGFDLAQAPAERFGLKIMQERCEAVGAVLEVESSPGEGTHIHVTWKFNELDGGIIDERSKK